MAAPVIRDGNVVGVICCEQVGAVRPWSLADRDFGACAADMAALFLEQADRLDIEASLRARRESELGDERMASLGRLARSVAHDVNNVLGALDLIGVALEADARPDVAAHGGEVRRTVDFGSRLVEQLLLFGRESAATGESIDLGPLLQQIRAGAGPAPARRAPRARRLGRRGGVRPVAEAELKQVVLNLCVNAAEAVAAGGLVRIELREPRADEPISPTSIVLAVVDDGLRDGRQDAGAHLRALLLDQAGRPRDRPVDGVRDRQAGRRHHPGRQHASGWERRSGSCSPALDRPAALR